MELSSSFLEEYQVPTAFGIKSFFFAVKPSALSEKFSKKALINRPEVSAVFILLNSII